MPPQRKTKCSLCSAKVFSIPRHMRQVHKWTSEDSKFSLNILRLRRKRKPTKGKTKNQCGKPRPYMECPVPGCLAILQRIEQHLLKFHSMKKKSKNYLLNLLKVKKALEPTHYTNIIKRKTQKTFKNASRRKSHLCGDNNLRNLAREILEKNDPKLINLMKECFPDIELNEDESSSDEADVELDEEESSYKDKTDVDLFEEDDSRSDASAHDDLDQEEDQLHTPVDEDQDDINETNFTNINVNAENEKEIDTDSSYSIDEIGPSSDCSSGDRAPITTRSKELQAYENSNMENKNDCETHTEEQLCSLIEKHFRDWLMSSIGSRKCEKSAKQMARQAITFIEFHNGILQNIFTKNHLRSFLDSPQMQKLEAKTIKSYIGSLKYLCDYAADYLIDEEIEQSLPDFRFNELPGLSNPVIQRFKAQLDLISKSYNKDVAIRFHKKQKEDEENLVTVEDIKKFDSATLTKQIKSWLVNFTKLSPKQLSQMRDYLIVQLLIEVANRPEPLAQMQVSDIMAATRLSPSKGETETKYVIDAFRHKTTSTKGCGYIYMNPELYREFTAYCKMYRNKESEHFHVFLNKNLKPFQPSYFSSSVQRYFQEIDNTKKVNATSFRKSAATHSFLNNKGNDPSVNSLMLHTAATAERYYIRANTQKLSSQGHSKLRRLMRPELQTPKKQVQRTLTYAEDANITPNTSHGCASPQSTDHNDAFIEDESNIDDIACDEFEDLACDEADKIGQQTSNTQKEQQPNNHNEANTTEIAMDTNYEDEFHHRSVKPELQFLCVQKKSTFLIEEVEYLINECEDMIVEGRCIRVSDIEEKLKGPLGKVMKKKYTLSTLQNRVKYLRRMYCKIYPIKKE